MYGIAKEAGKVNPCREGKEKEDEAAESTNKSSKSFNDKRRDPVEGMDGKSRG